VRLYHFTFAKFVLCHGGIAYAGLEPRAIEDGWADFLEERGVPLAPAIWLTADSRAPRFIPDRDMRVTVDIDADDRHLVHWETLLDRFISDAERRKNWRAALGAGPAKEMAMAVRDWYVYTQPIPASRIQIMPGRITKMRLKECKRPLRHFYVANGSNPFGWEGWFTPKRPLLLRPRHFWSKP
jgi:hypothetical protein